MTTVKMSLHRIISEIKQLEQSSQAYAHNQYVTVADAKGQTPMGGKNEASNKMQSNIDECVTNFKKLVALKTARNLANATNTVNFMGKEMTIDQVLAHRASLHLLEHMDSAYTMQFSRRQHQINEQNQKIANLVNSQIETLAGKNNKLSEAETKVVADSIGNIHKVEMIQPSNVSIIEQSRELIKNIKSELDYVLVEANARIEVEVSW